MFLSDITIQEKNLQQRYIKDCFDGNYTSAFNLLNSERSLQNKALLADFINSLSSNLLNTETVTYNNIDGFLDNLSIDYDTLIANFINKSEFNQTTVYSLFNFVNYNNTVYMYINNTPSSGILPTNTSYWAEIGLKGKKGTVGSGLTVKYNWSSTTQYNQFDLVFYGDYMWVAKANSRGQTPQEGSQYWEKFLEVGEAEIYSGYSAPTNLFEGQIFMRMHN